MTMLLYDEELNDFIGNGKKVSIISGAGISTNVGIKDFKSYDKHLGNQRREDILNINMFKRDPELFWARYDDYFDMNLIYKKEPSNLHKWVAKLEDKVEVTVITQNIDQLHQKAGSSKVIELHGSNGNYKCLKCGNEYGQDYVNKQLEYREELGTYKLKYEAPKCDCGYVLKPDIVLFGEKIRGYEEALRDVRASDTLIVLGTRLQVAPCSTLVEKFIKERTKEHKYKGGTNKKALIWNLDSTNYDRYMDKVINKLF